MQTGNLPLHTAIYFAIIFTSEINGHPHIHSQVLMNFKWHVHMGVGRFSKKNYTVDIQLEMDLFVQK